MTASTAIPARSVWFEKPFTASIRDETAEAPGPGEVRVRAICSLISQGTEMLVYRGLVSPATPLTLPTSRGDFSFPVKYAYEVIGEVIDVGDDVPLSAGELVFVRHPHQSVFTMKYEERLVYRVPEGLAPERAVFANLCEVAMGALLDAPVRLGEVVVVFGQGVVGQLVALLAARTARRVIVVDPVASRRNSAKGLSDRIIPVDVDEVAEVVARETGGQGVDIVFEASGSPRALQASFGILGMEGTTVALSYYGTQNVGLVLAPEFHFRRYRVISSQTGIIGSGLQPRWDFQRRMMAAIDRLDDLQPERLVSHRFALDDAVEAYQALDSGLGDPMGVLLTYP